jgi:hypothetical protein
VTSFDRRREGLAATVKYRGQIARATRVHALDTPLGA